MPELQPTDAEEEPRLLARQIRRQRRTRPPQRTTTSSQRMGCPHNLGVRCLTCRGSIIHQRISLGEKAITVDPSLVNTEYDVYDGGVLNLPANPAHRPNVEALRDASWLVD